MNQIYVVCAQIDFLLQMGNGVGEPVAAFSDYPSALTYAKSIFKNKVSAMPPMAAGLDPKDLIFMITLTPTPVPTIVNTVTPA